MKAPEKITINCPFCRTKIANIFITETNEERVAKNKKELSSVVLLKQCYSCNKDINFHTKKIDGTTIIDSFGRKIIPINTDIKGGVVISEIAIS